MIIIIYIVCFLGAAILQFFCRFLLQNGAVNFIPGSFIFYFVAYWIARKWAESYKEKKRIEAEYRNKKESDQ